MSRPVAPALRPAASGGRLPERLLTDVRLRWIALGCLWGGLAVVTPCR